MEKQRGPAKIEHVPDRSLYDRIERWFETILKRLVHEEADPRAACSVVLSIQKRGVRRHGEIR